MPHPQDDVPRRQDLVRVFGAEDEQVLFEWARQQGTVLLWPRALTNGQTDARVAVVTEQPSGQWPRKLVVKVCRPDDDADDLYEPGRHRQALDLAPDFAQKHLVRLAYEPLRVGDGVWIVFQELAGGGLEDIPPLATLVDGVADRRKRSRPVRDASKLAKVCRWIVRSLLEDWSPADCRVVDVDVVTFLGWQLGRRHETGRPLPRWISEHGVELLHQWRRSAGRDTDRLPDPLAVVTDPALTSGREVRALIGPAHGDLQPENILVPVMRRQVRASGYRLIDLARFAPDAPLARDPVHLLLSIVARHLGRISSPDERDALIRLLIDPDNPSGGDHVPSWLHRVTVAITNAVPKWVEKSFMAEWRDQRLLSLLACALVFTGRRTTPDAHRAWYYRLAVAAAHAYLEGDGEGTIESLWP